MAERSNCNRCIHRRPVPGDCHIGCNKPDPAMTVNIHGIRKGWFYYPLCFDPIWMTKECCNYEEVGDAPKN